MAREHGIRHKIGSQVFPIGQKYDGPYKADPSKSRDERRAELIELVQTQEGKDIADHIFLEYQGALDSFKVVHAGPLAIAFILNHEYPES